MFLKVMVIIVCIMSAAGSLFADQVFVATWHWTDESGSTHEYGVVNSTGCSWQNAAQSLADDWHLATVTSIDEQSSLITGLDGLLGQYWLGGYQTKENRGAEEDWAWVTGEKWNYRNWAPGEPNDFFGTGSEEYLAVWSLWGENRWLWNDEGYLPNISGYVVERQQSVPEPGTVTLFAIGLVALMLLPKKGSNRSTE